MIAVNTTRTSTRDAPFLEQAYTKKRPYGLRQMVARLDYRGYVGVFSVKKQAVQDLDELRKNDPLTPRARHVFQVMEPAIREQVKRWMARIQKASSTQAAG